MDNIRKSLTARLTAIFLFPLLVITLFGVTYYWISQKSAVYDASEQNARLLAETLSFSVGAGLNDGNFDLIQTSFNWARENASVAFVLILDESDKTIVEHLFLNWRKYYPGNTPMNNLFYRQALMQLLLREKPGMPVHLPIPSCL